MSNIEFSETDALILHLIGAHGEFGVYEKTKGESRRSWLSPFLSRGAERSFALHEAIVFCAHVRSESEAPRRGTGLREGRI